ncbi:hypothetical protein, partial [Clostridium haemolyticum]|uniref:hypothetical protein n=1 Tax=Clostridium haemolyticum TaxID=84025 RepID=UPI0013018D18
ILTFAGNGVLPSTVDASDFTVDGNVVNAVSVNSNPADGNKVTLTLAAQLLPGKVTVKPSSTFAIKDDMGNDLTTATLGDTKGITTSNDIKKQ